MTAAEFAEKMTAICASRDVAHIKRYATALCVQALLELDHGFAAGVAILDERVAQFPPVVPVRDVREPIV